MMMKAYSIYDQAAKAYMQPFFTSADGLAARMFSNLVNDGQSQVSGHPADFTLFGVGEFDDQTGVFQAVQPVAICTALSVKEASNVA